MKVEFVYISRTQIAVEELSDGIEKVPYVQAHHLEYSKLTSA